MQLKWYMRSFGSSRMSFNSGMMALATIKDPGVVTTLSRNLRIFHPILVSFCSAWAKETYSHLVPSVHYPQINPSIEAVEHILYK